VRDTSHVLEQAAAALDFSAPVAVILVSVPAVLTTRANALTSATPGDYVPGSAHVKVFLITMRGRFTAREASRPPGAKAPTGRYLSLVVDTRTFESLDFGIGPKPPPVAPASLGPVTYLTGRGR
jgi:hypothetical protein